MEPSAQNLTPLLVQIRHRMTETDHNIVSLAGAAGVPRRTVQDLVGTAVPMAVRNLEAIARALGCRLTLTPVDDAKESDAVNT